MLIFPVQVENCKLAPSVGGAGSTVKSRTFVVGNSVDGKWELTRLNPFSVSWRHLYSRSKLCGYTHFMTEMKKMYRFFCQKCDFLESCFETIFMGS